VIRSTAAVGGSDGEQRGGGGRSGGEVPSDGGFDGEEGGSGEEKCTRGGSDSVALDPTTGSSDGSRPRSRSD